jgi:hypothetical protein
MQAWVDHMSSRLGPRAAEARHALSEELVQWRQNPRKHGKVSKRLARQIAEGPPGPKRAGWTAVEAAGAIVTAALARKAVERFLSGEPPKGDPGKDARSTLLGGAEPKPEHMKDDVTRSDAERRAAAAAEAMAKGPERTDYSGLSSRSR